MLNSDNNNNNNCMYQSDVSFNSGIWYELFRPVFFFHPIQTFEAKTFIGQTYLLQYDILKFWFIL
jgi:hypothetical protein